MLKVQKGTDPALRTRAITLIDPNAPLQVLDGVVGYMQREGIDDIASLIGIAQPA